MTVGAGNITPNDTVKECCLLRAVFTAMHAAPPCSVTIAGLETEHTNGLEARASHPVPFYFSAKPHLKSKHTKQDTERLLGIGTD